jgi:hypothetical protein
MLWIYLLVMIGPLLLGLWAQARIKSSYARAAAIPASSGFTGAQTAAMILKAHNITDVRIEGVRGHLTDHYDPKGKVLRLSEPVFAGRSVAALGIAAHEAGHAIQDATRYGPLVIRNSIVPLASAGGNMSMFVLMGGMLAMAIAPRLGLVLLGAGILLFSAVVVFQLVNLPVEFDASRRARELLTSTGIVAQGVESREMSSVLSAAALTYVAATVSSIATLLWYVLHFVLAAQSNRE